MSATNTCAPILEVPMVARLRLRSRALRLAEARELQLAVATMFPIVLANPDAVADELGRAGIEAIDQGYEAVHAWISRVQRGAGF